MSIAVTLYDIEDTLVAMLNSIDMVEDPEARAAAEREVIDQHLKAVDKRDRVGQFLAHCDSQADFIDKEMNRLAALKRHFTAASERVEGMIINTIMNIGLDDSGKWRKLEGRTCSFSLAKNPLATEIFNIDILASKYKDVTVKMSCEDYEKLAVPEEIPIKTFAVTARKSEIKKALDSGKVPGAQLGPLSYRLNRK